MNPQTEMFRFFERTPDLVCIAGKDGFFRNINNSVTQLLGYSEEELFSRPIHSFIHPDDREITAHTRKEMIQGKDLVNFDNRYLTKSGDIVWLNWTSIYFPDQELVFAIAKNVTDRKRKEQETDEKFKKYRHLTSHFKASMETDKKNLAQDLHEHIAQMAWVVKSDLNWMIEQTKPDEQVGERLLHALSVTEEMITSVRNLSYSIGSEMLHEMGLHDSIRWLCNEFSKTTGIPCVFSSSCEGEELSTGVELELYRICQDSLKYSADHFGAETVQVFLDCEGDELCLSVQYDGKNIDPDNIPFLQGFLSMKQRAESVNGTISIEDTGAEGIHIKVMMARQFEAIAN